MTQIRQRTLFSFALFLTICICTNAQMNFNDTQMETSSQMENSTETMMTSPTESNMTTDEMSTSPMMTSTTLATILMNGSGFPTQDPMGMPSGQFPFQNGHFPPPPQPQPGQFPPPQPQPGQFQPPQPFPGQFPQPQPQPGQFPSAPGINFLPPNGQFPQPPPPQFGQPGMMPIQEGHPGGGINHPGMLGQQEMQDSSTSTQSSSTTSSTTITPIPDEMSTTSGTVVIYPVPEGTSLAGNQSGTWMPGKFPPPGLSSPGPNDQSTIPNDPSLPRFFDVPNNHTPHNDDVANTKYDIHKDHDHGMQGDDPSVKKPESTVGYSKEIGSQKATPRPGGSGTCVTVTSHLLAAAISVAFFHIKLIF